MYCKNKDGSEFIFLKNGLIYYRVNFDFQQKSILNDMELPEWNVNISIQPALFMTLFMTRSL